MRRDYFTVDVRPSPADDLPTIDLTYEGPPGELDATLTEADGDPIPAADLDVACRLLGPPEEPGTECVFSLTHRLTGQYVAEVNLTASDVFELVEAAADGDEAGRYRLRIARSEGEAVSDEKRSLLVYDENGGLLRDASLIPSGVEL